MCNALLQSNALPRSGRTTSVVHGAIAIGSEKVGHRTGLNNSQEVGGAHLSTVLL